jgi:hypothetical protein
LLPPHRFATLPHHCHLTSPIAINLPASGRLFDISKKGKFTHPPHQSHHQLPRHLALPITLPASGHLFEISKKKKILSTSHLANRHLTLPHQLLSPHLTNCFINHLTNHLASPHQPPHLALLTY